MKRFALIFLLMLGATRLASRPACTSEPPRPRHAIVVSGSPPALGSKATWTPESDLGTGPAPPWLKDARPAIDFKGDFSGLLGMKGSLTTTRERAAEQGRILLEQVVRDWLALDGVPKQWPIPPSELDHMVRETHIERVLLDDLGPDLDDYKVMYEAAYLVDFSPARKAEILAAYDQDLVRERLFRLAAVVVFVLACLAALAGYIRADEATKGYYTNRLRLVATAGVGAAGVVVYHLLT
jgi:hypothetical protein